MPQLLRWQSSSQAFIEPLGEGQQLTMLRIPAGRFLMGSPEQESGRDPGEGPVHAVELEEFLLASTPITQAQWRQVARWEPPAGAAWQSPLPVDPSLSQGSNAELLEAEPDSAQRPVERISWAEAMEFCRRLSQRSGRRYALPSEAQWEYACRAGSTGPYAFGDTLTPELARVRPSSGRFDDPQISVGASDSQQSNPVAMFPANAWGLYDMHGQVWEWCLDHWHDRYHGAPADGSAWLDQVSPASADRVLRGGAWSQPLSQARSACRYHLPAESHAPAGVGLRVVCLPGRVIQPVPQKPLVHISYLWGDANTEQRPAEGRGRQSKLQSFANQLHALLAQDHRIDTSFSRPQYGMDGTSGDWLNRIVNGGLLVGIVDRDSLRSISILRGELYRIFSQCNSDAYAFSRLAFALVSEDAKADLSNPQRLVSYWNERFDAMGENQGENDLSRPDSSYMVIPGELIGIRENLLKILMNLDYYLLPSGDELLQRSTLDQVCDLIMQRLEARRSA
jgi:formylglycine-generating enzyme required for sulfatase activity